jgi:hypothetical protein
VRHFQGVQLRARQAVAGGTSGGGPVKGPGVCGAPRPKQLRPSLVPRHLMPADVSGGLAALVGPGFLPAACSAHAPANAQWFSRRPRQVQLGAATGLLAGPPARDAWGAPLTSSRPPPVPPRRRPPGVEVAFFLLQRRPFAILNAGRRGAPPSEQAKAREEAARLVASLGGRVVGEPRAPVGGAGQR